MSATAHVRVAFVSSHAQLGGSERYLELVLERLDPAWVAGVVLLQDGPFAARLRDRGIGVQVVETPARLGILPAALRLRRVLLAGRPDVVHANGVKAALVTGLALLGSRTPIVWLKHDSSLDGPIGQLTARLVTRVVGVSRTALASFGPRLAGKLDVVHNGVPEPRVDPVAARSTVAGLHDGPPDAPVVLVVGRLDPAKGQQELLEILPALRREHPALRLFLLGGTDASHPGQEALLRERARSLGVEDAVRLLGHRDDAQAIIAGADVLAVPSMPGARGWREGFGLVGVEALWVGTPVVGYADGALPEVLGDCARLVPTGDRDALAAALLGVLGDAGLRERLTACGRARAQERYEVSRMVAALEERYSAVASAGA